MAETTSKKTTTRAWRSLIDDSIESAGARRDRAKLLADSSESVFLLHPRGGSALAGRDPSDPGSFRWTRFDSRGEPIGHTVAPSLEAAVLAALEEGYENQGPRDVAAGLQNRSV